MPRAEDECMVVRGSFIADLVYRFEGILTSSTRLLFFFFMPSPTPEPFNPLDELPSAVREFVRGGLSELAASQAVSPQAPRRRRRPLRQLDPMGIVSSLPHSSHQF